MNYQKGIKWFSTLNKEESPYCLFNYYPSDIIYSKFIVCQNYYSPELKKVVRKFALFDSFVVFYKYYSTLSPDSRKSFFEVILGKRSQKPHFDIDIPLNETMTYDKAYSVMEQLISIIIDTAKEKNVVLLLERDVCIYTSHSDAKFSVHIIIANWCHSNNEEARSYAHYVISKLPTSWNPKWVDPNVYSPTQQFRLLFSTKYGAMRHKVLLTEFIYKKKKVNHRYDTEPDTPEDLPLIQFEESLITFTSKCRMLPSYIDKVETCTTNYPKGEDISEEDMTKALDILTTYFECTSCPFDIMKTNGRLIYLIRLQPTFCQLCDNLHEHENPFIRLEETSDGSVNVYFYCRRYIDKKVYTFVGSFESDKAVVDAVVDNPLEIKREPTPLLTRTVDAFSTMSNMSTSDLRNRLATRGY